MLSKLQAVLELQDGNFKAGIKSAQESMEGASSSIANASKPLDGLKSSLKTVGAVVASAFAIDKIKDFGVASVESAATAEAIQAQFEQTFGTLDKTAQKSIDGLGKEFGMLPTRIKPAFTQTTAQFKGLGMTTSDSMEQASKATTIAADSAAFFDVSLESAQGSLNSFIKGNYEGGESIGIFANDAQMAAYAVKTGAADSTKAWAGMGEAQKQVIRLDFAKSMQESAGAAGQAAREMDGYENVMGNVKQSWQDFLAIVGAPILSVAIEGMKKLMEIVSSAGDKVKYMQENWDSLKQVLIPIAAVIGTLGLAFTLYSIQQAMATTGTTLWSSVAAIGTTATTALAGAMAFLTAPITLVVIAIAALVAGMVYLWNTNEGFRTAVIELWETIKTAFTSALEFLTPYVTEAWNNIKAVFDIVFPQIQNIVSTAWAVISAVFTEAINVITGLVKIFSGILSGDFSQLWEGIKQVTKAVWDTIVAVLGAVWDGIKRTLTNTFNGMKDVIGGIWDKVKSSASEKWQEIKNKITEPIEKARDKVKEVIDKIKGFFSGLKLKFPKIEAPKLPHFSLSGEFSLKKMTVPKLSVDWYATGGIATGPSVVGIGEAGDEAILPLSNKGRMKPFAQAVGSYIDTDSSEKYSGRSEKITVEMPINLDGRLMSYLMVDDLMEMIDKKQGRQFRKAGDV